MLQVMILVKMTLKNYAEDHGKKIIIIFVLIDLKREIKEDIKFVMRAKRHILNALLIRNLFDYINITFN